MELDLNHPCWRGYAGLLQRLGLDSELPDRLPAAAELNNLLDQHLLQKTGKPIRFVPAGELTAVAYEEHIYRTGEISTRENNWHDLFNALVWIRFPGIKAAMNARHFEEIQRGNTVSRGPIRDALTLFDECGAVVIGDDLPLLQALSRRDWQALFRERRHGWHPHMRVFLLGHALLEKLLEPYKAITAQVLIFRTDAGFLEADAATQYAELDELLASQVQTGLRLRSTTELAPLPLMGIPGWCTDQQQPDFYEDLRVFRPPPTGFKAAEIQRMEIKL